MLIDTSFDFRSDSGGKDPDSCSPTLRRYHKLLWSKPLPSGTHFDLQDTRPRAYLYHSSELGEFFLSSDSVMPTYCGRQAVNRIVDTFPEEERETFRTITYTMGGMMVFPGIKIGRKMTINGARGLNGLIGDRFDLTLECIRRHYLGQSSPLGSTLLRYSDFFALFTNFEGYIDFFILQDLVTADGAAVKFFMPFDDFRTPPVPRDVSTYCEFRRLSIEFVNARNGRMSRLSAAP